MNNSLFFIDFIDTQTGWAVGEKGTILHTADGGKTWIKQKSCTKDKLMSVHFVDIQTGWAVGSNNTILHTSNGGESWENNRYN